MNQRSKRISGILVAIAAVSALHLFSTTIGTGAHVWHIFLARLYFLPIVAAAVWFGFRAALATAVTASLLYAFHSWVNWHDAMIRMAGSKLDPELLKVFWRFVSASGSSSDTGGPARTD